MDKKEYIIRQLARTKNKKYEQYVVSRIVHRLNMDDVKFVTQQYVSRPTGRALTDLFFPQIKLHIEVDEPHHKNNISDDQVREVDIINATGHLIERVDVAGSIEEINMRVDEIVEMVKGLVDRQKKVGAFEQWDIEKEFMSETYIKKGYIDVDENVAFRTIKDACNCFGHEYRGYQKAGANHPDPEILLWFPKLYPNGEWNNRISNDEETIFEKKEDPQKAEEHINRHIKQTGDEKHKRIVFARVLGTLGDVLYRFKGQYKLDKNNSNEKNGLVWRRTLKKVKTFLPDSC